MRLARKLIEDFGFARGLVQEGLIERPELAIGRIVEDELLAAVEDRDRRRELVERARMGDSSSA